MLFQRLCPDVSLVSLGNKSQQSDEDDQRPKQVDVSGVVDDVGEGPDERHSEEGYTEQDDMQDYSQEQVVT
ncbi:hypothetical protein INR49_000095 [Caranx melampygus]|nr:hypothetical protein INR49_000095 [Caranx melampygus]